MKQKTVFFQTEAEAALILASLPEGKSRLIIDPMFAIKLNDPVKERSDAARKMRRDDVVFRETARYPGIAEYLVQNNHLIDLNAKSKRAKLIEAFGKLKEDESISFSVSEIDSAYARSVLSKTGLSYTTSVESGYIRITKSSKRKSVSADLKDKLNNITGRSAIVEFDGDMAYLRQIASSMRTPDFRYSVKQIDYGKYEVSRLFYEDVAAKKNNISSVFTNENINRFLTHAEVMLLETFEERITKGLSDRASENNMHAEPMTQPIQQAEKLVDFWDEPKEETSGQKESEYDGWETVDETPSPGVPIEDAHMYVDDPEDYDIDGALENYKPDPRLDDDGVI